jgi:tRNA(Arg) A34 adenosine deaminase TadA
MEQALAAAERACAAGEVPVGAVLVEAATGAVLAASGNRVEALHDPTAHAEILVLREGAAKRQAPRLDDCDLYVTLEPCAMCAAAISFARIRRLYFRACDLPSPPGDLRRHRRGSRRRALEAILRGEAIAYLVSSFVGARR